MISAIVTDIEGTTTSLAFVRDVLFPHSRAVLRSFLAASAREPVVIAQLEAVRQAEPGADPVAVLERWIAEDKKATPLKTLQGLIWDEAYRTGLIVSHLYLEVPGVLRRWVSQGAKLYVFSSGSVQAQQALFAHSREGDLTPLFSGWFDTTTGPKREASSYQAITRAIGVPAAEILFLSDVVEELDAAKAAGMQTLQVVREAELPSGQHGRVARFDAIAVELRAGAAKPATLEPARAQVATLSKACHRQGWAPATGGNFSVRVDADSFAITVSGVDKGQVEPRDTIWIGNDLKTREPGKPSAETPLHAALYRRFPQVGAVAHTHSVASTVLSRRFAREGVVTVRGYEMQKSLSGITTHQGELRIPVVANSQDLDELAARVDRQLAPGTLAYLVEGHGLTTWAIDPAVALRHVEGLEFLLACELAALR